MFFFFTVIKSHSSIGNSLFYVSWVDCFYSWSSRNRNVSFPHFPKERAQIFQCNLHTHCTIDCFHWHFVFVSLELDYPLFHTVSVIKTHLKSECQDNEQREVLPHDEFWNVNLLCLSNSVYSLQCLCLNCTVPPESTMINISLPTEEMFLSYHGSRRKTWEAIVKLIPTPAARKETSNT